MALVFNGRCLLRPVGGVERYARMLLEALVALRIPVRVVMPAKGPEPMDLPQGLDLERRGSMSGHAWEQLVLPAALRTENILLSPANTGPLRVRRQFVVVHDLAFLHDPTWFDVRFARWYGFLLPRLVRRCAGVIAVSGTVRQELIRTFALPADKVHLVPPFASALPAPVALDGIAPGFHLFVGADDPRKDVTRSLELLLQADPEAIAVVVGRQRRSFQGAGISDDPRVRQVHDATDGQLAWLYDKARCLVYPSRYEGFGLPVLEALSRGCPVIARPLPVFAEAFGDAFHACAFTGSADLSEALRSIPPVLSARQAHPVTARYTLQRTSTALARAIDLPH
ncbi:MAG: glycosyltransferase family 4 protein [Flavobacteriales bacterium]|nr:glycosyltransferase family 4 protein [Flavobacteriales bacterium]